jgi:hypothetical protein
MLQSLSSTIFTVIKIHKLPEIDQVSKEYSIVFVRDKDHTLCLRLIMLRLVLSPIHILNSLIVTALTISLALSLRPTSSSQSPSLCHSPWKKCLAQSPLHLLDLKWILGCTLARLKCLLCVFFGICELGAACTQFWFPLLWVVCVWVDGVGNVPLSVMNVFWQTRGWRHWSTGCNLFNNHVGTKPVLPGSSFFREPPVGF